MAVVDNIAVHIPGSDIVFKDSKARVRVLKSKLRSLAKIDQVKSINGVRQPRLFNNIACQIMGVHDPIRENNDTYKGKGQIVCVADTGFDTGNISNYHAAFDNRVIYLQGVGRQNCTDDPDGHGTHVCGSVLGNGVHQGQNQIIPNNGSPTSETRFIKIFSMPLSTLVLASTATPGEEDAQHTRMPVPATSIGISGRTNGWSYFSRLGMTAQISTASKGMWPSDLWVLSVAMVGTRPILYDNA